MTIAALLALAAVIQSPVPSSADVPATTNFGPFTLSQAQVDGGGVALPHPELRLEFQTTDRETKAALVDDGTMLGLDMSSKRCGSGMRFLAYRGRIGEPQLFATLLEVASLHYKSGCGLRPEVVRSHLLQLRRSRADFAAGIQAMKARAADLLGGWQRRCRAPKMRDRAGRILIPSPSPHDPCRGGSM